MEDELEQNIDNNNLNELKGNEESSKVSLLESIVDSKRYSIFNKGEQRMSLLSNISLHETLYDKEDLVIPE